jgi:hypothetical protein
MRFQLKPIILGAFAALREKCSFLFSPASLRLRERIGVWRFRRRATARPIQITIQKTKPHFSRKDAKPQRRIFS